MTYTIMRFYMNGRREELREGVTLEKARTYCQSNEAHGVTENGDTWFDGFINEEGDEL